MITSNLNDLAAHLERIAASLAAPPVEAIAQAQAQRGRELLAAMFTTATSPSGAPWLPAKHDYGHPLLVASGALADSAECTIGPRDDASGYDLTFRVTDEKAPWHHFGTFRGGIQFSGTRRKSGGDGTAAHQHIPPRPLMFDDSNASIWKTELDSIAQRMLDSWLAERINL
jgi:hypothetical protein